MARAAQEALMLNQLVAGNKCRFPRRRGRDSRPEDAQPLPGRGGRITQSCYGPRQEMLISIERSRRAPFCPTRAIGRRVMARTLRSVRGQRR
jgi:hypothetical protein